MITGIYELVYTHLQIYTHSTMRCVKRTLKRP